MRYWMVYWFAALMVGLGSAPARAEWWEARTDHFIVYSESSASNARSFAEKLERFDQALRSLQGMGPDEKLSDSRRLTVFRTGDIGDVAVLAGDPGSGIAGFYIPRASGPVAFAPAKEPIGKKSPIDARTVLFHEYAHHFMFRYFSAAYPSWYVEAFAELNSTIELQDDGTFHLGKTPQSRADALFGGLPYTVGELLLSRQKPSWDDYMAHYSHGWLLTHYLTFEKSRAGQLQKYLKAINGGTDPAEAAREAFGDIDRLEREIGRYKRKNRFPGVTIQPANFRPPEVAMRKLGRDEELIMRVRMRSARGVNMRTGKDVAGDARGVAAKYPHSLPIMLALAEAEIDLDRHDEAEQAADAALAINPSSVEAMIYKGRVFLERGKSDRSHFATARRWFGKASRFDPGHPSPLHYNYLSYKMAGERPTKTAVLGLERAFELAPYDSDLRMLLVYQLLAEREGEIARRIVLPLALSPHESKAAKALNEVLELINGGRLDEALARLNARIEEEEKDRHKGSKHALVGRSPK